MHDKMLTLCFACRPLFRGAAANREFMRVPAGNGSRAETLASMNRIETRVKNAKARFIVQHDAQDFQALPKFPAYLD